jgi:hypothetical protein
MLLPNEMFQFAFDHSDNKTKLSFRYQNEL